MRVLVVEDSPNLGRDLRESLVRDGHAVDLAGDGALAQQFLASYDYDALVLDLMMPRVDGWAVLRALNGREPRPRILVLSARDQVEDGSRRCIWAPTTTWSSRSPTTNCRRGCRRWRDAALHRIRYCASARWRSIPGRASVRVDGEALALTPKEYALLETLCHERGRVMTRSALFERLYDARSESSDKVIEVLVSTLRAKLAQGRRQRSGTHPPGVWLCGRVSGGRCRSACACCCSWSPGWAW